MPLFRTLTKIRTSGNGTFGATSMLAIPPQAIRLALEVPLKGADVFVIANPDTVMSRPTSTLLAEVFPGVPVRKKLSLNETLVSIDKARRVLGYEPQHSWRNPESRSL